MSDGPQRRWILRDGADRTDLDARARRLRDDLDLTGPAARLLALRLGADADAERARQFLRPSLAALHDPGLFRDMPAAVERLLSALRDGERILVHGDYDVDGLAGTAILVRTLRLLEPGAADRIVTFVPHRIRDGYSLSAATLARFADDGVTLVVTVDCGTSDGEALEAARARGVDVVVTDHHTAPERVEDLPQVTALLNPRRPDATYPFPDLCGAGVAYKLAWALCQAAGGGRRVGEALRDHLVEATALAAMGTVADVVPLHGENRVLTAHGLRALGSTDRPGLRALLQAADVEGTPDAGDLGFRLGPRLNAAGRVGEPATALELLLTDDPHRAAELAETLEGWNRRRRAVEREALDACAEAVDEQIAAGASALIVAGPDLHRGVAGIVAGRLVDRTGLPAVVLCVEEDGTCKGSGRAPAGCDLLGALNACGPLLTRWGGHRVAAGLELPADRVPALREALDEAVRGAGGAEAGPVLEVDMEADPAELTDAALRDLEHLGPHGRGNPAPALLLRDAVLATSARRMGRSGRHLEFRVAAEGCAPLRAVGFGFGDRADDLRTGARVHLAVRPVLNRWRGRRSVEVHVLDLRTADAAPEPLVTAGVSA